MTTEAVRYWRTKGGGFPDNLVYRHETIDLVFQRDIIREIGLWIIQKSLIPDTGNVLDIASGQTTLDVFPTVDIWRLYAIDASQQLLDKSGVLSDHKFIRDIGNELFPTILTKNISFATLLRCSRYLDIEEKIHAAEQIRHTLTRGGLLLIMDMESSIMSRDIGEARPFNVKEESNILKAAGFTILGTEHIDIYVTNSLTDRTEYSPHDAILSQRRD